MASEEVGEQKGGKGSAQKEHDDEDDEPVDDDEFTYIPVHINNDQQEKSKVETEVVKAIIANDGSFLEKTKALLEKK
jgi:hypothetical protein